jgi:hypothetical protein
VAVIVDAPEQYWAAVYVAQPLAPDDYRKLVKSIGDGQRQNRHGQVMLFDDRWARDMVLPENQSLGLTHEEMVRWGPHLRVTYVRDARSVRTQRPDFGMETLFVLRGP